MISSCEKFKLKMLHISCGKKHKTEDIIVSPMGR